MDKAKSLCCFAFLECFDTVAWVIGRTSDPYHLSPDVLFGNRCRKKLKDESCNWKMVIKTDCMGRGRGELQLIARRHPTYVLTYIHHIHKSFLYNTYKFNRVTMRHQMTTVTTELN